LQSVWTEIQKRSGWWEWTSLGASTPGSSGPSLGCPQHRECGRKSLPAQPVLKSRTPTLEVGPSPETSSPDGCLVTSQQSVPVDDHKPALPEPDLRFILRRYPRIERRLLAHQPSIPQVTIRAAATWQHSTSRLLVFLLGHGWHGDRTRPLTITFTTTDARRSESYQNAIQWAQWPEILEGQTCDQGVGPLSQSERSPACCLTRSPTSQYTRSLREAPPAERNDQMYMPWVCPLSMKGTYELHR